MSSAPKFSRTAFPNLLLGLSRSLLFLLLLVPLFARAASAEATLSRSTVQLGETVTLNLRVAENSSLASIDAVPLEQDFNIVDSSPRPSMRVVNGVPHLEIIFSVILQPKHVGTLTVPALVIGDSRTEPLQLEVTPPDPRAAAEAGKEVFVEATTDTTQAYVGQQLLFTVRVYYTDSINSGTLVDPTLTGVDLRRLNNDLGYQVQRGGRAYNVQERRYTLMPQQAGQLDIPPMSFQGVLADPNDINSFLRGGTPVTVQSSAIRINVRAAPADAGHARWLPARKLELSLDGAPAQRELRVGQPLNLTMNLRATGLPYEALPELSLPAIDGATVYPDKPVPRTRSDDQWLLGERQQSFAIVPERAGTLVIPETTLHWFNVLTGKPEIARIPAQQFNVLAAPGTATVAPPAASAVQASPATSGSGSAAEGMFWRWLALASLALWLLSLVAWLLWRRPHTGAVATSSAAPPSIREARQAFLRVATGGDVAQQAQCLLAWARAERPALQNLGELSERLAAEAQRLAIAALQRRLYAPTRAAGSDPDLVAAFKSGFAWREHDAAAGGNEPLPPLYPFKLDR